MNTKKEKNVPEIEILNSKINDITVCQLRSIIDKELQKDPASINTSYIDACFGLIKAKEALYNKLPNEFSYVDFKRNLIQTALVATVVVLRLVLLT